MMNKVPVGVGNNVHKLPCLYTYISQTKTGDRNTNLFKAINHLRHYNKTAPIDNLVKEALQINKSFDEPLGEHEVRVICNHVIAKDYRTSCWKFKQYCQHCKYGKFHKNFKDSKPNYWKHLNEDNKLVNIKNIPDNEFHPWDITDTSKLHDIERKTENGVEVITAESQKATIYNFREMMGIPMAIDTIVKSYGIPIGDKAKREWNKFRKSD